MCGLYSIYYAANNRVPMILLGGGVTKHWYIYELKYLVNSCETMLTNIRGSLIYDVVLVCELVLSY